MVSEKFTSRAGACSRYSGISRVVRVALVGNSDRAIVEILHGVDDWLIENALEAMRVQVDHHTYTLTPPIPIDR